MRRSRAWWVVALTVLLGCSQPVDDTGTVTSASTSTCVGDIDGDGHTDFSDYLILSTEYGSVGGALRADFDGDGTVGFGDYLTLSHDYGCGPGVTDPRTCVRTGCYDQLCAPPGTRPGSGFCPAIYNFRWACLDQARCELQTDGSCGFTDTPAFDACVAALP